MSKGLEALERLVDGNLNEVNYYRQFCDSTTYIMKDKETIEKELKDYEQYKAIEEELGIDLIAFGKVLQALDRECIYVKIKETKQYEGYSLDEETGEIRRCVIVRFSRYSNGSRDWFFTISWGDLSSAKNYLLKDYGKTWALTKEELE